MTAAAPDPRLTARVAQALSTIDDPCLAAAGIPGSITELGLIQDVRADEGGVVEVDISLTEMGCAFTHHLLDRVWNTVEAVDGVTSATVSPIWTWSPAQMGGALRARLDESTGALPDMLGGHRRLPLLTS